MSCGTEVEFETKLVDELCVDDTLIENWHRERPGIEIQNEMTKESEEEVDNPGVADNKAGVQGSVECHLHGITSTQSKSLKQNQSRYLTIRQWTVYASLGT